MRSLLVLCKTASSAFLLVMLVMRTLTEALCLRFEPHTAYMMSHHCISRHPRYNESFVRGSSVACVMCPGRVDIQNAFQAEYNAGTRLMVCNNSPVGHAAAALSTSAYAYDPV